MSVSVAMITKNEEKNIRRCLESIKWVDEIVIVDDYSDDKTVKIAGEYTSKIYQRHYYPGEGKSRKLAHQKCSSEWILMIDADEEVTDKLKKEILQIVNGEIKYNGFKVIKLTKYMDKWCYYPLVYRTILVKKDKAEMSDTIIHAGYKVEGKVGILKNYLLHHHRTTVSDMIQKLDKYSTLQAKKDASDGVSFSFFKLIWEPVKMFLWKFFILKGIKGGTRGFYWSVYKSNMKFFEMMKLFEQEQKNKVNNRNDGIKDG
jgi:glycosyltransferase involved in cell wall biosynthesis